MPDDFKDHPQSIAEIKAQRAVDGGLWSPRDALIAVLRDIDDGKVDPSCIFIAYGVITDAPGKPTVTDTHFAAAGENNYIVLGIIERAKHKFMDP